ncbi:Ig-like domain-containing protein [Prescottella defluvii]|uniref:Ig-like domain-containing protein n=1 Tax=Prescottella defluvii TaxID=1323361 RepID=UPI0004F35D38|nr:Ig-like domain-containing protein [Prescottella defluvii]
MFSSTLRRIATPVLAAGAAMAVMLGAGAGVAAAADPPPASASGSADNLRWSLGLTAVNGTAVDPSQAGVNVVRPGDTVTYTSKIWKTAGIGRYITGMRQVQPAGFEYLSHTVSKQSTVTSAPGGVTAYCSGGGCNSVPILGNKGYLDNVDFAVTYKIPANQAPGDYNAGFVFDVYAFGSQSGANPAGAWVRVEDPREVTSMTLTAPASIGKGSPANLTATVSPSTATGTVQFFDGANPIGDPVTVSGGTATLSHAFDTMGTSSVSAKYTATGLFHDSEAEAQQVEVGPVVTSTAVTVPATAEAGSTVQLQATVTPADAQGTVQFAVDGTDVGNPVQVSGGTATLNHRFDDPGNFAVTANFAGGFGVADSAATAQQIDVSYGDWQTTTVVVEPVTAEAGSPTNLMATVRPIPTGGTVTFSVDGTEVGTADVATADGVAVLEHTFDTAGTYQVVAEFAGTEGFSASTSAPFTATVVPAAPVLTAVDAQLTVQGLSVVGQTVTLTVDVDPADAQGTVQFYKGTEAIGAPVAVVDGKATITTTLDSEGTQLLSAKFLGGEGFRDTVSNPVVLNVSAAPETTDPSAGSLGSLTGLFSGSLGG